MLSHAYFDRSFTDPDSWSLFYKRGIVLRVGILEGHRLSFFDSRKTIEVDSYFAFQEILTFLYIYDENGYFI